MPDGISIIPRKTLKVHQLRQHPTYIYIALLIICIFGQCQTKSSTDKPGSLNNNKPLQIDSAIVLLKNERMLSIDNVRKLNIIDPVYSFGSNGDVYCDTTVQLTDDIFYSIISLPDTFGVCSYHFVLTVDERRKKPIASQYLNSHCDIDFSVDSYSLYDYVVVSKDSILIRETIIYQKKVRDSKDEEKNIQRKEVKEGFLFIRETGEITSDFNPKDQLDE